MNVKNVILSFPKDTELAGCIKNISDKVIIAHKEKEIVVLTFGNGAVVKDCFYWSCPDQTRKAFDPTKTNFFDIPERAIQHAVDKGWTVTQITLD